MRDVAVTEGDKVEAQIQLGWTVDYWPVGELVDEVDAVSEADIDAEYKKLSEMYTLNPQDNPQDKFEASVRYQLREYLGIKKFLDDRGYNAFCTNFQDLKGLKQLPGLAAQLLMRDGYGFAAEGDWKHAALARLLKIMAHNDRTVFMEDYMKLSLVRICSKLTRPLPAINRKWKCIRLISAARMTRLVWYSPVLTVKLSM